MHGRIKVRTTEEQQEIARREKNKKALAFREAMTKIVEMRSAGLHDQDALSLTWHLLTENPDIISLWNYRREIFGVMKKVESIEGYQKLLEKDLNLTEQCLRVNPKSYGSWHHRIWILDNLPQPDWEREMKLCTKYLQLDERNFHCWDYRRIIAERCQVPDSSEYEFTMEKIETNFSNYSAWHLRSKLLPKIFPDPKNRFPIDEIKHKEELELVENAAFTDPSDQSAWFYLRWLLGLKAPKTSFLLLMKREDDILVVVSKNVKLGKGQGVRFSDQIAVEVNGKRVNGTWSSQNEQPRSCLWTFTPEIKMLPEDSAVAVLESNGVEQERRPLEPEGFVADDVFFRPEFSPDLMEAIDYLLSSCNQLLEIEPDSKWTLLTKIFLMTCIDSQKHEEEIKKELDELCNIDPARKGYYQDLRSKLAMEIALAKCEGDRKSFSLTGQRLTSVYYTQYLWDREEIDLSRNEITDESSPGLYPLISCRHLNLSGNKFRTVSRLPTLPLLESLSLENNLVGEFEWVVLEKFPNLKRLNLSGNPAAETLDVSEYSGPAEIVCSSS